MPVRHSRALDVALTDLIKRRKNAALLFPTRMLLDPMIDDLKNEMSLWHERATIRQRREPLLDERTAE